MKKISLAVLLLFVLSLFSVAATPAYACQTTPDGGNDCPGEEVCDSTGTCVPPTAATSDCVAKGTCPAAAGGQPTGKGAAFIPLTDIPHLTDTVTGDPTSSAYLTAFFNNLYKICIGAAGVLAVIQLIHAGILYMGPDSVSEKKHARDLIAKTIFGLLLVLSPVIVFTIINPSILSLQVDTSKLTPNETNSNAFGGNPNDPTAPNCVAYNDGRIVSAPDEISCCTKQGKQVVATVSHIDNVKNYICTSDPSSITDQNTQQIGTDVGQIQALIQNNQCTAQIAPVANVFVPVNTDPQRACCQQLGCSINSAGSTCTCSPK